MFCSESTILYLVPSLQLSYPAEPPLSLSAVDNLTSTVTEEIETIRRSPPTHVPEFTNPPGLCPFCSQLKPFQSCVSMPFPGLLLLNQCFISSQCFSQQVFSTPPTTSLTHTELEKQPLTLAPRFLSSFPTSPWQPWTI